MYKHVVEDAHYDFCLYVFRFFVCFVVVVNFFTILIVYHMPIFLCSQILWCFVEKN